jgi:CheY-like chemotaxis protein
MTDHGPDEASDETKSVNPNTPPSDDHAIPLASGTTGAVANEKCLGTILYADDDEPSRQMISELLSRHGYVCATAPDGLVAEQMLVAARFDCLISDIHMLGNEELEFIRVVQQRAPGLPVILVTAHPSVTTAVEAMKLPVVAYLLKPIESDALVKAVGCDGRAFGVCRLRFRRMRLTILHCSSANRIPPQSASTLRVQARTYERASRIKCPCPCLI